MIYKIQHNSHADDSDDDESLENDLPVNDAHITWIKTVQHVVKDVYVLHQNNVVNLSVKKRAIQAKLLIPFESEMKIPVYTCQDNDIHVVIYKQKRS